MIEPRATCFACGKGDRVSLFQDRNFELVRCPHCFAEWVEGIVEGDLAYSHQSVGPDSFGTRRPSRFARDRRWSALRAERFARYLVRMKAPKGKLLDVGCADGAFIVRAHELGWQPTGVELNERSLAVAASWTLLPLSAGDISNQALFPPKSQDVVTLWGVLEHCPRPHELLRAGATLLRPGGFLLLETPNPRGLFRSIAHLVARRNTTPLRETLGSGHVVWYSPESIRAAAKRLGLRILDLRGSRNQTTILLSRFEHASFTKRLPAQAAVAGLNLVAKPIGRPNQVMACLRGGDSELSVS